MTSVESLAKQLMQARRVVFLCGAGLSVPSGIRAYRSGPNAIWDENVTTWGTLEKFRADPVAWWRDFWLVSHGDLFRKVQPNAGHLALAAAMGRCADDLVVTQNVDGLHRQAGHPEGQLIEIHGRHDRFICSSDGSCPGVDEAVSSVDLSQLAQGVVPTCGHCGEAMRPLVLLFDELYDMHPAFQARRARKALNDADVLVFIGTSFSVGITSYAVRCADVSGALTINVNLEPAPLGKMMNLLGSAELLLPRLLGG